MGLSVLLVPRPNASSQELSKGRGGRSGRGGSEFSQGFRLFWLQCLTMTRESTCKANSACNPRAALLPFQCQVNAKQGYLYILDIALG